jgi:hypothetical protein
MVATHLPQFISPDLATVQRSSGRQLRYTLDGDDALEDYLQHNCELVKEAVVAVFPPNEIEGLLLGGGYGRGEGGVLQTREGQRPYNDLEFYLFVRGNRHLFERRYRSTLGRLSHELARETGIEVELKVLTLHELRQTPISMFFHDMVTGHRWLLGDDKLLRGCEHHCAGHLLPLSEATRLLMNRCSGLLLAQEQLAAMPFECNNADFIRRNISKAQLAMGDAVLTIFGRYHWSCRERHERLKKFTVPLPWRAELIEHHRRGVEFKLRPYRSEESREQLARDLNTITGFACEVWLWTESKRLHHSFISPRHYATSTVRKWPNGKPARNFLVNSKLFERPIVHKALRHPRERILESLALLLWETVALSDSGLRDLLQMNLRASLRDRSAAVGRYQQLWSRVS